MIQFQLTTEYIELFKLLKIVNLASTGGHAKLMIEDGEVQLNNQQENRKRAKLKKGDIITVGDQSIEII